MVSFVYNSYLLNSLNPLVFIVDLTLLNLIIPFLMNFLEIAWDVKINKFLLSLSKYLGIFTFSL